MNWTKTLQNIALFFASTLMTLLLAEFITRSFFPQNLSGSWRVEHDSGLLLNKTSGTAKNQFGERIVTYRFGEFHSRKTEKQNSLKQETSKLLVLGDSFTFGILLPDGKTYVDRLQKHFQNEYEIINAAVGGWGASDYTKYVELFCDKIKPEQIFIYLSYGDIDRSVINSLYTLNNEGQIETGKGHKTSKLKIYLNNFRPSYQFLLESSHLVQMARAALLSLFENYLGIVIGARQKVEPSIDFEDSLILGKKLFLKIKNDAEKCGADLKVFNTAWEGISLVPELDDHTMHFLHKTNKENFFSNHEITFFDLTSTKVMQEVIANKEKFIITEDVHPNELGAERIFLATLEHLNSE